MHCSCGLARIVPDTVPRDRAYASTTVNSSGSSFSGLLTRLLTRCAIGHQPFGAHALELATLLFDVNPDLPLQRLEPGIPIPHLEGGLPVHDQPRVGDRAVPGDG